MNVNNNLRPSNSNSSERTADERRQIWYLCARMVPSIRVKNRGKLSNSVQRCKNGTVKGNPAKKISEKNK